MDDALAILQKAHAFSNLKGKNIAKEFGENIDGYVFVCADLQETDWTGVKSAKGLDLRCANLNGANLPGINTNGWDCTGSTMQNAVLDGAEIYALMHGVVMFGTSMNGIVWNRGGHAAARGIILPEFVDFSTWINGRGFHAAIAKILEQDNPGDREVLRACDYILGQSQRQYYQKDFPCWKGFVSMCQAELSEAAITRIYETFAQYPSMRLVSMWDWAERELSRSER